MLFNAREAIERYQAKPAKALAVVSVVGSTFGSF
jgi:hypothetical protein